MLIPLGAWCRTAYQVNSYLEKRSVKRISFPFDWTITPFETLTKVINPTFDKATMLLDDNLRIGKTLSILDSEYAIIFHHDLSEQFVSQQLAISKPNQHGIPLSLISSEKLRKTRERFQYTFQNLRIAAEQAAMRPGRLGFVRWIRSGHPDQQLPSAFQSESLETLWKLLSIFAIDCNVAVLQIMTKMANVSEIGAESRIVSFDACAMGAKVVIQERPGFNGDGTDNYKGDSASWEIALSKFVRDFNISINSEA